MSSTGPKILFIHTSAVLGGSEKAFLDLMSRYPKELVDQTYFVLPFHGPLEHKLIGQFGATAKILVKEFPPMFAKTSRKYPLRSMFWTIANIFGVIRYVFDLRSIILKNEIDIVYSNGIKCHILSAILKRISTINVVWHLQDFFPHIPAVNLFLKLFGVAPDLVIANSQNVLDDFNQHIPSGWKINSERVVHNSVDPSEFLPALQIKSQPLVISLVAMLTPWKGQEIFIEAIKLVKQSLPNENFEAWIVGGEVYKTAGESGYLEKLRSVISADGLDQTVFLKGLIEDVQSVYHRSEIVVHCSTKPEPFGRVIIEAMSSGCAVIASGAGGVIEIIDSEKNGLLVSPGRPRELADAIIKLITDANLRKQLGTAARQKVIEKFSAAKFADDIFSELRDLS